MVLLSLAALGITDQKPAEEFNAGNEMEKEDQLPAPELYEEVSLLEDTILARVQGNNQDFFNQKGSQSISNHLFIDILSAFNQDPLNNDRRGRTQPQEASFMSEHAKVIPQIFFLHELRPV